MAISLTTNLNSIRAQGQARRLSEDIQNSTQKISSGSRIIHASDDAASLALSEKFKANIRSSSQSMRNGNDAISILQTIESNLNTVTEITSRMRELSVQAASETNSASDKQLSDLEFQQLKNEILRLTNKSTLNGSKSISGTAEVIQSQIIDRAPASFSFRVGGGSSESENIVKFRPAQLMMSASDYNLSGLSVSSTENARSSLGELDQVLQKVMFSRASLGGLQSQLAKSVSVSEVTTENAESANSRLRDVDYASETAFNIRNKIVSEANISVLAQSNINPQAFIKLIT